MPDFSDYTEEERGNACQQLVDENPGAFDCFNALCDGDSEAIEVLVIERMKSNRQSAELLRLREMLREGARLFHPFRPPSMMGDVEFCERRAAWLKKAQEAL